MSTAPQGFKKTVSTGLDLHVNANLVVNLTLEIGPVSETVTVSNEAASVETRSGEVSSLVSEKQVTELPLNGRNYAQLVLMVPGVSPTNDNFNTRGTGLDSVVGVSVNGNSSNQNLWTVDGVNNMDVGSNQTLLVYPSIATERSKFLLPGPRGLEQCRWGRELWQTNQLKLWSDYGDARTARDPVRSEVQLLN